MGLELGEPLRRAALAGRRAQVEKTAAADGALRGGVAQDEAVARSRGNRLLQHQLHARLPAGRNRLIAQENDASADLGGGMMEPHRHPLRDWFRLGCKQPHGRIDPVCRRMQVLIDHHVAARDCILANLVADEIERAAVTGPPLLCRSILGMDRAHARGQFRWAHHHAISDRDRARQHRAGDHGARPCQHE